MGNVCEEPAVEPKLIVVVKLLWLAPLTSLHEYMKKQLADVSRSQKKRRVIAIRGCALVVVKWLV